MCGISLTGMVGEDTRLALDGGYEVQFVGVRGVLAAVAVIVVASVVQFRAVVRLARFAQTSCTEKKQMIAINVNIDMIDIGEWGF